MLKFKVLYRDGKEQIIEGDELDWSDKSVILYRTKTLTKTVTRKFLIWSKTITEQKDKNYKIGLIKDELVASILLLEEKKETTGA